MYFFSSLRQVATWRIYLTNPLFCGILYTYSNHHVILWVTCTPLVLLHNVFTPGRNAQCIQSRNHRAFPDNFIKSPYLSRIEDLPPKQTAGGSTPPGDAKSCRNRKILALFYVLKTIYVLYHLDGYCLALNKKCIFANWTRTVFSVLLMISILFLIDD